LKLQFFTIIPGSSDENRYQFFDIPLFPIDIKEEFQFYNADNILHQLVITKQDDESFQEKTDIIDRKNIYSIKLDKNGIYDFRSPQYSWMKGQIFVNDNAMIKTKKLDAMNLQLTWIVDNHQQDKYYFKILFTEKKAMKIWNM